MAPTTVMAIYGTRPEAIKMAPIVKALNASPKLTCEVAVTGQHRTMLDQINRGFGIVPTVDLDIFSPGQSPAAVAGKTFERIAPVLAERQPAAVLVQGDTTSALAAGIAAFYARVPVIHVEAGLRTATIDSPFPEEANRRLLTQIAALHLAPTLHNRDNLLKAGVRAADVVLTGNPVIDALHLAVAADHQVSDARLAGLLASSAPIVLVTSHRRESWGEPMRRVAVALARLAANEPATQFVFPLHANPIVRDIFAPALADAPNVALTEPLDYFDLAKVLARCAIVLTDSGGLQEEAPALGKPVLVLREETERPEGIEAGTAILVGTDTDRIVQTATHLLHDEAEYARVAKAVNPYGDGQAAARTVAALAEFFHLGHRLPDFAG